MYTIKQAAAKSGLTVPTVRVWERRYGVIHPERTATGYRLYDDDAIDRLVAMRQLVEGRGMRPSQAAEHLLAPGADIRLLVEEADARAGRSTANGPSGAVGAAGAVDAFVEAAHRMDIATMEQILDERFAAERFEATMDHVVFPSLHAVGAGWVDGRIDPAMEHAASETIRRRLARFFDAAALGDGGPPILVGLPPGGHHEIGALAFAVAARRRGLHVVYLGADVPLESWRIAVEATDARAAVIGVVGLADVASAAAVVAALRRMVHRPVVALGGARAAEVGTDDGAMILPDGLESAVAAVRESIAPGA